MTTANAYYQAATKSFSQTMLDTAAHSPNMQRAKGRADVGFGVQGLKTLYQSGCAKVLLPQNFQPVPEAVFINTSGGVTGGDQLSYAASVQENAALTVTTQAAERIYRASSGVADISNSLALAAHSQLAWLPQETILFEGSALKRRIDVEMDKTATLLALEMLVLGRRAMGETLQQARLSDQWRIRRSGRLIYADALRFSEPKFETQSCATFNGQRALATLVYVAPDAEYRISSVRNLLDFEGVEAAASAWNGRLVVRFLAPDAQPLRAALILFLTKFRGGPLPRVWHM